MAKQVPESERCSATLSGRHVFTERRAMNSRLYFACACGLEPANQRELHAEQERIVREFGAGSAA